MDARTLEKKLKFINDYKQASNAATGSQFDSNANVATKNIATLTCELGKKDLLDINRKLTSDYITQLYGEELGQQYLTDLKNHIIYRHDETSLFPYCCSISLYPYLLNGLEGLGGSSSVPKHANSFIGGMINLIFLVASQFAGACMYKDQKVLVKIDNNVYSLTSKELFNKFAKNIQVFNTLSDTWEYSDVSNIEIFENGTWVKLNKVMRRPYNNTIYNIKTKGGLSVYTSKDHKFKHLYRNRDFETSAENLKIGDTIYVNREFNSLIDKNSSDYKIGQIIGLIAGDGNIQDTQVRLSINTEQLFIADFLDDNLSLLGIEVNKETNRYSDKRTPKVISYYIGSTLVSNKIKSYFKENCYGTFTKEVILEDKSLDWKLGFLDGLLTSDGCYSKGHCLKLTITNDKLINQVKKIINEIYLDSNITVYQPKNKPNNHELYTINVPMTALNHLELVKNKPCWSSIIAYEERPKHQNTKTLYYSGTTAKSLAMSKVTSVREHRQYDLLTDVVTDITCFENDDDYVYEVETSTHWYNCGGAITHNCAIPEFLTYFDHFLRLDYGNDYMNHLDDIVEKVGNHEFNLRHKIEDWFQQFVYSINQPAGARNYQSPFVNIAYFDKYYFESIFKDFIFPDGDEPCWESTKELQKLFMKWFNKEREKTTITFPVESFNILVENGKYKDEEMADFAAEMWSEGHSFFMYQSDSVDSLSSCCRLRNGIQENVFSYTLGAGGIETGSKCVITLNLNRIVQDWYKVKDTCSLSEYIRDITVRVHKYLNAWNAKLWDDYNSDLLGVYKAGFIDLDKQYLTVGVNGFVEAAEFLKSEGFDIEIDPNNKGYQQLARDILGTIKLVNKEDRTKHSMFNTEFVPGENASAKLYAWDKRDGYKVPEGRNLYNSYFYIVEDTTIDPVKKFYYQGQGFATECDGGVALHNNLDSFLSKEQYRKLMDVAVKAGCNYFTYNIPATICNDCGCRDKRYLHECPECGSTNLDYETRIIGYLRRISNFSEARQLEASRRYYGNLND